MDFRDESAYFRRFNGRDELWFMDHSAWQGLGASMPSCGTTKQSCLILLEHLIRSRLGFEWAQKFVTPGIIKKAGFTALIRKIDDELNENTAKTLKNETKIVRVARELGLAPKPSGTHDGLWKARCPGKNHFLEISAAPGLFFCGYCKRSGGEDELRGFVVERNDKKEG